MPCTSWGLLLTLHCALQCCILLGCTCVGCPWQISTPVSIFNVAS